MSGGCGGGEIEVDDFDLKVGALIRDNLRLFELEVVLFEAFDSNVSGRENV